MKRSRELDAVSTRGSLTQNGWTVNYYTTTPAPSQWVAVGVVVTGSQEDDTRRPRRMLVGRGRNELAAINELADRFSRLVQSDRTQEVGQNARAGSAMRPQPEPTQQPAERAPDPVADPSIADDPERPPVS